MTTPCPPSPEQLDGILDALALIDAVTEGNDVNRRSIMAHCDLDTLVTGLVVVASSLRQTVAANMGCTTATVDELLRAMYLSAGAA